jgi:hypothetical protein
METRVDTAMSAQQQQAFVAPSTELRQNITIRRSTGRARDSLDSTSIPVADLLSRKSVDRKKDAEYSQETDLTQHERFTSLVQSPSLAQWHRPSQETFDEGWAYLNRVSAEIGDEPDRSRNEQILHLEQRDLAVSQMPGNSEQTIIWFEYRDDEISYVLLPGSSIRLLVEVAVGILGDRGISVTPSQVILRFDEQILDGMASVSDYGIVSEDIVEIHILPPSSRKAIPDPRSVSPAIASRNIFQKEHEQGQKDRETGSTPPRVAVHDALSHQSPSSSPVRDIFQPPRDIFRQDNVRKASGREVIPDPVRIMGQQVSQLQSSSVMVIGQPSSHLQAPPRASHLQPSQSARPVTNHPSSANSFRQQPVSSHPSPERMTTYYGVRKGHRIGICDSWEELLIEYY